MGCREGYAGGVLVIGRVDARRGGTHKGVHRNARRGTSGQEGDYFMGCEGCRDLNRQPPVVPGGRVC